MTGWRTVVLGRRQMSPPSKSLACQLLHPILFVAQTPPLPLPLHPRKKRRCPSSDPPLHPMPIWRTHPTPPSPLPRTNHLLYRTLSRLSRRVLPLMADNSPRANTTRPRRNSRGSSDCYDQRSGIGRSRVTVRDMTNPMLLLLEEWERRRRREVHLIPKKRRP